MPIGVAPRAEHVETERDEPQHGEQPVEEIEAAGVEVGAAEPPMASTASGDVVDHLDKQAAEPRRDAEDAEDDGAADGLHAGGHLAVEELEQADEGGDVQDAEEDELRRQPERRHGRPAAPPASAALVLDHGGRGDGQDAGGEPDPRALQVRDAAGVPRRAPQPRHDGAVVDQKDEDLDRHGDDGEARRRDGDAAEPGVHGPCLLHGEREQQRERDVGEDGGEEDGNHAKDGLGLLHLRHRAQRPRPRVAVVHRRLVKEPWTEKKRSKSRQLLQGAFRK